MKKIPKQLFVLVFLLILTVVAIQFLNSVSQSPEYPLVFETVSSTEIAPEADQLVEVKVTNEGESAYDLKFTCMDLKRLKSKTTGPGSMQEPIQLAPGASHLVQVLIDGTTMGETVIENAVALNCLVKIQDDQGERWTFATTHTFTVKPKPE